MSSPSDPSRQSVAIWTWLLFGLLLASCRVDDPQPHCAPACESPWTFTTRCTSTDPVPSDAHWTGFLAEGLEAVSSAPNDRAFVVTLTGTYTDALPIYETRCLSQVRETTREVLLLPEIRLADRRGSGPGLMLSIELHCLVGPLPETGPWTIRYSSDIVFLTGPPSQTVLDNLPRANVDVVLGEP